MNIKKNSIPNKNYKTYNTNISVPQQNQPKIMKLNTEKNMTPLESKNYNNFMGVFGVHPNNTKYYKKKKKKKTIDCKTPDKHELKGFNALNDSQINKRVSKSPFKMKNFLFGGNKEGNSKENTKNNEDKENKLKKNNKDNKENEINKENKNPDKSKDKNVQKDIQENKKILLKRASKIYELSFWNPYNDKISLLDGEGNSYNAQFDRKEYEINIIFNDNIFNSFNDIHFTSDYFKFPLYYISKIKYNPDSKNTTIKLKDYRSFKIQTKDDYFYKTIKFDPQERIDFLKYAIFYNAKQIQNQTKYPVNGWHLYNPINEFERQKVPYGMDSFRLSQINLHYKLCETYPSILILPSFFQDSRLVKIASCRIKNRFPVLTFVYTHPNDDKSENIQTFLFRSAQINTGSMFNKKSNDEIEYINSITNICKHNKGFIFYDCRPYLNAKANSLKGAGIDDVNQYENCKELIFGCIENIHAVRKSLKKAVEKINSSNLTINNGKIASNTNNNKKFLSKFEESKWLEYLSDILCGANLVANKILSKINVICHCSDGWDRTSQICSLVQIILDPYFRTFEGFAVLIEKDWVSFGHQFAIRNGCDCRSEKKAEKSPIFIQFLHTIYQIMAQYPNAFEFRENMLIFLSEEIYSNKFGTFLFNCEKEINENNGKEVTLSIWSEIFLNKRKYINPFYECIKDPLNIKGEVQYLCIWKEFFYKYIKIGLVKEKEKGDVEINGISNYENMLFKRNKSLIELMNIIKKNGLEKEMENNELYKIYKDYLNP